MIHTIQYLCSQKRQKNKYLPIQGKKLTFNSVDAGKMLGSSTDLTSFSPYSALLGRKEAWIVTNQRTQAQVRQNA